MALNLVQHRGEPNVWDEKCAARAEWDTERWLLAVMAGAFLVTGFRRRSAAGLLLVLGGGGLAWWASAGADERRSHKGRFRAALPSRARAEDMIHEAAEESFPASDAPSWTPTTASAPGSTTHHAH